MPGTKKQINSQQKTTKNRAVSDGVSTKGCLTLVLVIAVIAALIFFVSQFIPAINIPKFGNWNRGPGIANPFESSDSRSGGPEGGDSEDRDGVSDRNADRDGDADSGPDVDSDRDSDGGSGAGSDRSSNGDSNTGSNGSSSDSSSGNTDGGQSGANGQQNEAGRISKAILAEYEILMTKHDILMDSIELYKAGAITLKELRDVCAETNETFSGSIDRLNHIEAGEYQTDKYILVAAAMSNQIATVAIMKSADGDIANELGNPASDYNRNAADADEAYLAFMDLMNSHDGA